MQKKGNRETKEWINLVKELVHFPLDRAYGSHVLPLFAAAYVTTGPILEMGSGFFSTPMLSKLAQKKGRFHLTADTDSEWLSKFKQYESKDHPLVVVPNGGGDKGIEWENIGRDKNWSLVFVDQRPAYRRGGSEEV